VTLYNFKGLIARGVVECDVERLGPGPGPGSVPATVGSMFGVLLVLWKLGDLKQMLVGNRD
jgi:hypothetical protein